MPGIDEVRVHLVVTTDSHRSHMELGLEFEDTCMRHGAEAHMKDGAFDCYLILCREVVTHAMLGHELLHVMHQICERIGQKADNVNDELTARIAGYLNGWTYRQLEKMGIPVAHKYQKSPAPFAQI